MREQEREPEPDAHRKCMHRADRLKFESQVKLATTGCVLFQEATAKRYGCVMLTLEDGRHMHVMHVQLYWSDPNDAVAKRAHQESG